MTKPRKQTTPPRVRLRIRKGAHQSAGLFRGLVIDYFAGGGGASMALEMALGRAPDVAVNHDAGAIKMHEANHPNCRHVRKSVFEVDPIEITGGRPVDVLWASPDCCHFSSARGGTPVKKNIRGLAWVVVKVAARLGSNKPKVIFLENVLEFKTWGPLRHAKFDPPPEPDAELMKCMLPVDRRKYLAGYQYDAEAGRVMVPDKKRQGNTFAKFVAQLRSLGYHVEWRQLNAADFGANTHRRRLFLVARCDGKGIHWPNPTHGPGRKKKWRPASECIRWDLPAPSIFLDKAAAAALRKATGVRCNRPLKPKTLKRVANGIVRYVIRAKRPFLVRTGHWSNKTGAGAGFRGQGTDQPLGTVCSVNDKAIVAPYLVAYYSNGSGVTGHRATAPLQTVTAKGRFGLATPYLVRTNHGTSPGTDDMRGQAPTSPLHTITGSHGTAAIAAHLVQYNQEKLDGDVRGQAPDTPLNTIVSENRFAISACSLVQTGQYGGNGNRISAAQNPLTTIVSKQEHYVSAAHLVQFRGDSNGKDVQSPLPTVTAGGASKRDAGAAHAMGVAEASLARMDGAVLIVKNNAGSCALPAADPLHTVTTGDRFYATAASLAHFNHGEKQTNGVDEPLRTITANGLHAASITAELTPGINPAGVTPAEWAAFHRVWAFLREQLGPDAPAPIIRVKGQTWLIVDIGLRMLTPRELLNAQFTPKLARNYVLTGTDANQVKRIGNSVSPPPAIALIKANCGPEFQAGERRRSKAAR